jgi:hypothetical protein
MTATATATATAIEPKRRGDAILATMQAQRAYAQSSPAPTRSGFDEAHAIVERLVQDGFIVPAPKDQA